MLSEKSKGGISREAQEMRNRLSLNYSNLQYRFEEFVTTPGMLRQEGALQELLFDIADDDFDGSLQPFFITGKKRRGSTAAGGPSPRGGPAAVTTVICPPIDNMGLTWG
jgi:hypothetical protein